MVEVVWVRHEAVSRAVKAVAYFLERGGEE